MIFHMKFFKKLFNIFAFLLFIHNFLILHSGQIVIETVKTVISIFQDPELSKAAAQALIVGTLR